MGFQPMIDAYEEWTGASWTSRRELLAFSAGAEVLLRVKDYGSRRARGAKESRMNGAFPDARGGYSNVHWTTYKPPDTIQGLDDITCLRLLRSLDHVRSYQAADGHEPIIFGTAKGDLKLMKLPLVDDSEDMRVITSIKFDTKKRPVRSIDLTADGSRLAACLSDAALAVYPISIDNENTTTLPSSEIDALGIRAGPSKRLWSTRWLSSDQLAVGLGPSDKPLHVYQVTESGLDAEPIRKFGIDGSEWGCDDRVDLRPESAKRTSSVYPIITLPTTAQSGDSPGDVFLTGCYDGIIR